MEQALVYARRTPNAEQKIEALARLAELALPGKRAAVLSEVLDAARSPRTVFPSLSSDRR
jgi:hypothetical protein